MAHIFNCIGDVDGQSSFGLLSKSHTPEPLSPRLPDPASPNTNSNDTNRPPSPAQTVARRLLTTIQKHQTPQQQQQQKQDSWLNLDTPTNMATPQPSSASAQQQQQQQQPKRFQYQLFPKQTPTANIAPRGPDIDKALAAAGAAAAAATVEKDDQAAKFAPTASLKTKISQHSLVRRRKVSVPDLGPMTTVHEVPMDSPTIPGRPPIHERSTSAPADDGRFIHAKQQQQQPEEEDPLDSFLRDWEEEERASRCAASSFKEYAEKKLTSALPRQLAPLIIPNNSNKPASERNHPYSAQTPSSKGQAQGITLPSTRYTPTPSASATDLTSSAISSSSPPSANPTPSSAVSAPTSTSDAYRYSPKPWEGRSMTPVIPERSQTPQPPPVQRSTSAMGHRRGASESSSLESRGRARMRADQGLSSAGLTPKRSTSRLDRTASERSKTLERRAFEELPRGFPAKDAVGNFSVEELAALHRQAYMQVERFEILRMHDVESLSKELRRLDERTEYLRRTYNSLRSGRRNLHGRICQFLRSPRMARFSPESMLKQEEALTELDASIDDWATKLEMAENRRTRVRQKLLEHVAAAAVLMAPPVQTYTTPNPSNTNTNTTSSSAPTPPRSPTKPSSSSSTSRSVGGASSPSPQRRGSITGVPSTILENPVGEEAASAHRSPGVAVTPAAAGLEVSRVASLKRADVESIRIYAGDEITTLLASVENEITRLSHEVAGGSGKASPPVPEQQHTKSASLDEPRSVGGADWQSSPRRKALHRQQSHELLSGWADVSQAAAIKIKASRAAAAVAAPERAFSPPPPTPPAKD